MTTTLSLWINDQPDGTDGDHTADYIRAAGYTPAPGIAYDTDAVTLTGEPEAVYAEFRRLAGLVADAGHGDDADGRPIPGEPTLTACPVGLIEDGYTCAAESLARSESTTAPTYAEWSAAVPSMRS